MDVKEKKAVDKTGLQTIRANALLWSQMDAGVCQEAPHKSFRDVMVRLPKELQEVLFIHKSCGITFGNKV